jgi:hypothetical protein
MTTPANIAPSPKASVVHSTEWSVSNQVRHLPNGDKAALRRTYLTDSYHSEGVVQSLLFKARVDSAALAEAEFQSWRLMAHAAAVISGTSKRAPHSDDRSLGRSLQIAGLKEAAILRLLTARGPALPDQIRRIARLLARGGDGTVPTNLKTLRELADPEVDTAEEARRRIARDFYAALDAAKAKKAKEDDD